MPAMRKNIKTLHHRQINITLYKVHVLKTIKQSCLLYTAVFIILPFNIPHYLTHVKLNFSTIYYTQLFQYTAISDKFLVFYAKAVTQQIQYTQAYVFYIPVTITRKHLGSHTAVKT